jgi:hypothetical protein
MLATIRLPSLRTYTVILESAEEYANNRISSKVCLVPTHLIVNINSRYLCYEILKLVAHLLAMNTLYAIS